MIFTLTISGNMGRKHWQASSPSGKKPTAGATGPVPSLPFGTTDNWGQPCTFKVGHPPNSCRGWNNTQHWNPSTSFGTPIPKESVWWVPRPPAWQTDQQAGPAELKQGHLSLLRRAPSPPSPRLLIESANSLCAWGDLLRISVGRKPRFCGGCRPVCYLYPTE